MELGNILFGNSRGEWPVPRTEAYSEPWRRFCDRMGIDSYGYCDKSPSETGGLADDTYVVNPYDWDAECDCGADDAMEDWFVRHPHGDNCYQTVYRNELDAWESASGYKAAKNAVYSPDESDILAGFNTTVETDGIATTMIAVPRRDEAMNHYRTFLEPRQKTDNAIRKRLCKERKLTFPKGSAVHCDCGRDDSADAFWQTIGGHKPGCRFIRPNFLHKPTGFSINWYKYPFRDSYASREFTPREFAAMLKVDA